MRKTIITVISSFTVVVGTLGAVGTATMAPAHGLTAPATVKSLCDAIPGAKTALVTELDKATKHLATATTTVATRRTNMTTAISTFGASIVTFLKTVDANGNTAAAGNVLKGHQSQFVDAVVAWSGARNAALDADKDVTFAQLRSSFLQSAETTGCPVA
jgi:hypothetical protein